MCCGLCRSGSAWEFKNVPSFPMRGLPIHFFNLQTFAYVYSSLILYFITFALGLYRLATNDHKDDEHHKHLFDTVNK